ncbi:glycosidase [Albibacterium bauzanense]|uniref:Glycosidase n=2 Tax=Albibacterium bauzanense TaxID=653929 RepID=A0A4R1LTM7_9SPHI|nr:glycosidase [Albibacterium bauzanense]
MKIANCILIILFAALSMSCQTMKKNAEVNKEKVVLYQMMVRLFGNQDQTNAHYGSKEENGVGKFNDITTLALSEIKKLGVSHIWYTGVLEHAMMTDYTTYGISLDDGDVVKGRAGSPYAIKDYYDVDPDLAVKVDQRIEEFEALVKRTHALDLKVIIDFVPNHVARKYHSDKKPAGVRDFGEDDNRSKAFSATNDFYYIPGEPFIVPTQERLSLPQFEGDIRDGRFDENPAKATGNNIFSANPSDQDWYETVKLNYGIDYQNGDKEYLEPIPPVWEKTKAILLYWAEKGVDGFRCDMAEMVPVEFWNWVIPQVKTEYPNLIFIAEAYNPMVYEKYLTIGKFDYLYDKVGLYDALKPLIKNDEGANVEMIRQSKNFIKDYQNQFLSFLENHDEERIASAGFAGNPLYAQPAMVVSATISGGPIMLYFGQEVGEPGKGNEGYGGEDNRTTIFDYWGVPEHQKWMNNGKFDGGGLSTTQKDLRSFYGNLLRFVKNDPAIVEGTFTELEVSSNTPEKIYAFIRSFENQHVLVLANFNRDSSNVTITLPKELLTRQDQSLTIKKVLTGNSFQINSFNDGISLQIEPSFAQILKFEL